eukprot:8408170-Pyramimonas_sp.AAC.1
MRMVRQGIQTGQDNVIRCSGRASSASSLLPVGAQWRGSLGRRVARMFQAKPARPPRARHL